MNATNVPKLVEGADNLVDDIFQLEVRYQHWNRSPIDLGGEAGPVCFLARPAGRAPEQQQVDDWRFIADSNLRTSGQCCEMQRTFQPLLPLLALVTFTLCSTGGALCNPAA